MVLTTVAGYRMRLEEQIFRLLRKLASYFFKTFKLRPASYPYLTGDGFRKLADHIHDETSDLNPREVKTGDIVFVSSTRMNDFFQNIHPLISYKYILIEHNGDNQVDENITKYIDDKIIRFYAQCVLAAHDKIVPIPIGIENRHHGAELFSHFIERKKVPEKSARIFYHFSPQTNPAERNAALNYFKTNKLMDTIERFIPYASYKRLLSSYCFTASPAGNTLGSHRTWEALYLRTIPIVKRTVDAQACVSYGLPLWIIDDWQELGDTTEEKLRDIYDSMMSSANYEALYMDYWIERIKKDQVKAKEL